MEWEIRPFGKASTLSGNLFEDGEEVHCLLIRNEDGVLVRADLQENDLSNLDANSVIVGRWTRIFESGPNRREESRNQQRTLEELFFSLFDVGEAVEAEETDTLKQIVSLMLERKRVLRRLPAQSSADSTRYVHVKSRREFQVNTVELTPKVTMNVQEQLAVLVR